MSNHTPGPWKILTYDWGDRFGGVKPFTDPFGKYAIKGKTEEPIIASVSGFANARLIAAAPEMVEALEYAVFKLRPMLNGDIDPTDVPMEAEDVIQECEALLRRIKGKEEPK